MQKKLYAMLLIVTAILCACQSQLATFSSDYPIGEGTKITGKIENWQSGAISGIISNHYLWIDSRFGGNIGKIESDGTFLLGFPSEAQLEKLKQIPKFNQCGSSKPIITPNSVKIYPITFQTSNGNLINTDKPFSGREAKESLAARYIFSDGAASISGECSDYSDTLDFTLKLGWNTIVVSTDAAGRHRYSAGVAPPNLKWFRSE